MLPTPGDVGSGVRIMAEAQQELRLIALAHVLNRASAAYLAAAELLEARDDPIADCLRADEVFDLRRVVVFHDHLAEHWRLVYRTKGSLRQREGSTAEYSASWLYWLVGEASSWAVSRPRLLRCFLLAVVQPGTSGGLTAEMDLWDQAVLAYPVPGRAVLPST